MVNNRNDSKRIALFLTGAVVLAWWVFNIVSSINHLHTDPPTAGCLQDSFCAGTSNSLSAAIMATIFTLFTAPAICFLFLPFILGDIYRKQKLLAVALALLGCTIIAITAPFIAEAF